MKPNTKVQFRVDIPESATFAPIPKGTPALVSKPWRGVQPGLIYVRIRGERLGYNPQWFFKFVPEDTIEVRN